MQRLWMVMIIMLVTMNVHASKGMFITEPLPPHTLIKQYSNLTTNLSLIKRPTDYPTQIVRVGGFINQNITCEQVFEEINHFFTDHIPYDLFFYNTINYCSYNPETQQATQFLINSYFDPLNDEAITHLKNYLSEHQGMKFLGQTFLVEDALGLVVSLNIDSGIEYLNNQNKFLRLKQDNANHYFDSDYDMRINLIRDIDKLYSHDTSTVLSFFSKWLATAGNYALILRESNYIEIRPELIFLMDNKPKIFNPYLKLYYANHCTRYENEHCL